MKQAYYAGLSVGCGMNLSELDFRITEDRPSHGHMWHNGPNSCWVTVTHRPSGCSVTAYAQRQYEARAIAVNSLKTIVENLKYKACRFPEAAPHNKKDKEAEE